MVRIKIRMISTAKLSRQLFQMDYFLFFPEALLLVFVSSSTSLLVSPNGFLNDALVYLNLERNHICFLGDVFMNYLNILQIKLANNCLSRFPNFEIKTDTDRPTYLVEVDIEFNHFKNIQKFSNAVSQIKVLKFDSNNISVIDDDAFFNLNELKSLYLANNSLRRLSQKDFFNFFRLLK